MRIGVAAAAEYEVVLCPCDRDLDLHSPTRRTLLDYGEDPNDESDPRWPTMVLDPDEALDVLIDMWFPVAPATK